MRRLAVLLINCCLFFTISSAQQTDSWPKTMLWRISGNGLHGDSYLYGTIHLQDKRVFYFTDSLYNYLEQADGYAMEVDLQEFTNSLIQKAIDQKEDEIVEKEKLANDKEKKKIVDSLVDNVMKRNDKTSKRQLMMLRQEKMKRAIKNNEMPTILDAYLFGIAQRQGKWVGGIEDIQDQLNLYDELGGKVTSEELTAPDAELTIALERMIEIYQSGDLNRIQKYSSDSYSTEEEDMILVKRNLKMAERMDSMAVVRRMFFAVGAAHLPGKQGVINELRKRGYHVDPVFSSTKMDPFKYTARLKEMPWVNIVDDSKTYSVDMPGKAGDLASNYMKMKFYMDVSTLTCFIATSIATVKNADAAMIMDKLEKNTEANILSKKIIKNADINGVECILSVSGYYYRSQYLFKNDRMYMLMAGGSKEEDTESAETKKFFASFKISEDTARVAPAEWSSFGLKEKAFTIMLPGTARHNKKIDANADTTNWRFTTYDCTDDLSGIFFMVQIRDLTPGYHLSSDSSSFASFRTNMGTVIDTITRDSTFTFQSFPALGFDGKSSQGPLLYKTLNVNRGNRVYILFAGGPVNEKVSQEIDRFLQSFTLTDYEPASWKKEISPQTDFSSVVPGPIKVFKRSEEDQSNNPAEEFVSYEPNTSVSYQVLKTKLSPYYWISSDSLFFDKMGREYIDQKDSVISKTSVTNGKLKGVDWVIKIKKNDNIKKLRQLLNGDTMYTLITYIPSQHSNLGNYQQFFDEFRVTNENINPTIFESKAARVLTDLQSHDSATYEAASKGVYDAAFAKEDLPLLHKAMISLYLDDSTDSYYNTRTSIISAMKDVEDSSTVQFVKENYPLMTGEKERIKMDLLDLLAKYKASYSYSVLKDLLINQTPGNTGQKSLSYSISDSLELTCQLFPEILKLSANKLFAQRVISITDRMIDSNAINIDMVRPYEKNFITIADTTFAGLRSKDKEDDYDYVNVTLLHLLHHFKDAESNSALQSGLLASNLYVKHEAVINLLENKQPVAAKEIEKVAADNSQRRNFYDRLVDMKQAKLFPAKYLTQQYMASSDMYEYASDEDIPDSMVFLRTKQIEYRGEIKRFYLYRIDYSYTNEDGEINKYQYFGVAGPYAMDLKNIKRDFAAEITGFDDSIEEFDIKKLDRYFQGYIKRNTPDDD